MPNPANYDNESDWMAACVPVREGEGDDHDQAVAVCLNMWREKAVQMTNNLKTLSKTEEELRVGNYMVLFGGKDLTGEWFTDKTEFESQYTKAGVLYVDWEHGMDDDNESPQRDDVLGLVDWKTAKKDDKGLWVERVLSRRNEYMQYLEQLIDDGLIGTSSEAVGGKVRKAKNGEIQVWPLKRDALTVQPAEPRMMSENTIHAIKALSEFSPSLKALLPGEAIAEGAETVTNIGSKSNELEIIGGSGKMAENITMSEEQFKQLLDRASPKPVEESKPDPRVDELTKTVEALLEQIQHSPKAKDAGYVAPDSEEDHPEVKSFGDFLVAVRQNNAKRLEKVYKTALAEGTGASGGYGVPTEYGNVLLEKSKEYNALRRAGAMTTTIFGRSKEYPVVDIETAPSAGDTAYAGGVVANWTSEAASITESEPRFRLVTLNLHKIAAYALASSEVRDDFVESLDGILARAFARAVGSLEEYAFFRGVGVGSPLGIMSSGALITATRSAGSTVALADLSQMISDLLPESWGRAAWFYSPTVVDQLIQLVSNPLSWDQNMRDNWQQPALMGMPLYPVGCLPALGTTGDLILADPEYYLIGDSNDGINIAFSEHFKFQNDQLAWRITKRVDGRPLIDNAITAEDASTTYSAFVVLS